MRRRPNYLIHHGVKGMKWGRRRYQNQDGSYTDEGARRYRNLSKREYELLSKEYDVEYAKATSNLMWSSKSFAQKMRTSGEDVAAHVFKEAGKSVFTDFAKEYGMRGLKAVTEFGISTTKKVAKDAPEKIFKFVADRVKIKSF